MNSILPLIIIIIITIIMIMLIQMMQMEMMTTATIKMHWVINEYRLCSSRMGYMTRLNWCGSQLDSSLPS